MGCSQARALSKNEEQGLIRNENKLNFHKCDILTFDKLVRKHSANHEVHLVQFLNLSHMLGFKVGAFASKEPDAAKDDEQTIYEYF